MSARWSRRYGCWRLSHKAYSGFAGLKYERKKEKGDETQSLQSAGLSVHIAGDLSMRRGAGSCKGGRAIQAFNPIWSPVPSRYSLVIPWRICFFSTPVPRRQSTIEISHIRLSASRAETQIIIRKSLTDLIHLRFRRKMHPTPVTGLKFHCPYFYFRDYLKKSFRTYFVPQLCGILRARINA